MPRADQQSADDRQAITALALLASLQLSAGLLAGGLLAHRFMHVAGLEPTGQPGPHAGTAHDLAWPWGAAAGGGSCSASALPQLCNKLPMPPADADPMAPLDAAARLAWMRAHPQLYRCREAEDGGAQPAALR